MSQRSRSAPIAQFHVRLRGFQPPIWRRLEVSAHSTMNEVFEIAALALGCRITIWFDRLPLVDHHGAGIPIDALWASGDAPLSEWLPAQGAGTCLALQIDRWRIDCSWERFIAADGASRYPRCTAGERSGIPDYPMKPRGFRRFLQALANPSDARHAAARRWSRRHDPQCFDLAVVNAKLRRFYGRPMKRVQSERLP